MTQDGEERPASPRGGRIAMRGDDDLSNPEPVALEDQDQFRLLVEAVKDYAIILLDREGRVTAWNPGAELIKGYTASEIVGEHFAVFYTPEDVAEGKPERLLRAATRSGHVSDEGWRVRKDGSRFWASVVITAVRDDVGALRGFGKVTRDLTDRVAAEEARLAAERAVLEKEVRLQEIHHRVKNNLQVISGLLAMQAARVADGRTAEVFRNMQARIRAISLIHQKLYEATDDRIGFGAYVRDILAALGSANDAEGRGIALAAEVEDLSLPMETAIPLGLVVNELVTNALKHAFPRGRTGNVRITLASSGSGTALLTVADDGVGTDAAAQRDDGHSAGLGLQIIESLIRQLKGAHRVLEEKPGTRVEVEVPLKGSHARA